MGELGADSGVKGGDEASLDISLPSSAFDSVASERLEAIFGMSIPVQVVIGRARAMARGERRKSGRKSAILGQSAEGVLDDGKRGKVTVPTVRQISRQDS